MKRKIAHVALVVNDYDEAINFYVNKLKFTLVENTKLDEHKRWVIVSPDVDKSSSILLAKADGEKQQNFVGNQSGGRVFLFLNTDNFEKDYQNLLENGIKIIREPKEEPYGTVAVFEDLYGNLWDLIQPK
ncbi:VOC family protein [uncultured Lutibacter sp.]|uniref:VOC family protein n=1 Tax=uncultured Lutibacter sp. TaxID=437739 RepID=UPI0026391170|nr:VOC family protein [uncultured Lutibacter sp.]